MDKSKEDKTRLLTAYQTFREKLRQEVAEMEAAGDDTGEMHRERIAWQKRFLAELDEAVGTADR